MISSIPKKAYSGDYTKSQFSCTLRTFNKIFQIHANSKNEALKCAKNANQVKICVLVSLYVYVNMQVYMYGNIHYDTCLIIHRASFSARMYAGNRGRQCAHFTPKKNNYLLMGSWEEVVYLWYFFFLKWYNYFSIFQSFKGIESLPQTQIF